MGPFLSWGSPAPCRFLKIPLKKRKKQCGETLNRPNCSCSGRAWASPPPGRRPGLGHPIPGHLLLAGGSRSPGLAELMSLVKGTTFLDCGVSCSGNPGSSQQPRELQAAPRGADTELSPPPPPPNAGNGGAVRRLAARAGQAARDVSGCGAPGWGSGFTPSPHPRPHSPNRGAQLGRGSRCQAVTRKQKRPAAGSPGVAQDDRIA